MAKKVQVTSVTPASKIKATSKTSQARTRNLVMGIASVTPVGRAAKAVSTIAKGAKTAKATKAANKGKTKSVDEVIKSRGKKQAAGVGVLAAGNVALVGEAYRRSSKQNKKTGK